MANPRKFSEKIALLNQKQAEETARFEQIMKEVLDVTSRKSGSGASAQQPQQSQHHQVHQQVLESSGPPSRPLSVKSAGASPPQSSSGKHLHISSLGQQYRAGGSLPNVNAANGPQASGSGPNAQQDPQQIQMQQQQQPTLYPIDLKTALNSLEEMQHNQIPYRQSGSTGSQERSSRPTGVGPMRSRPVEKRHDTSPYSGVPYLSPPLPENWRRTNSDSALHQSATEACQANASMAHRRGSENYQRGHGGSSNDNRDPHHHGFIERPRSSCEMPRVPGINVYPSSQPPGQQIPIGNNTGSLPDLSNMHFASPHMQPLDQEDHSSGSPYSNSPQTSSPTTLSPTSFQQAGRLSLTQDHSPPNVQNHLSVPVNHRYLHSCKQGLTVDNNTSGSQQDVRITYSQQPQQQQTTISQSQPQNIPGNASPVSCQQPLSHSPGHYNVYQQPHSPVAPGSPNASQTQLHQQNSQVSYNSLNSYRTSQMVNRPSPQSSPSLTLQGSPLSYSNNPSGPSSPTGHHGPPSMALDSTDASLFMTQVQGDLEQFTMDWAQVMKELGENGYILNLPLGEMDSPSTTISTYINPPSHSGTYTQSDILSVTSDIGSVDGGYFSTSPLQPLGYQTRTPTTTQQLTPQTPNTPTITLTDCSLGPDDRVSSDFANDFTSSMAASFDADLFSNDDTLAQDLNSLCQEDINALRQDLEPPDFDELQRLANSDMVISDPTTEADFRLEH